MPKWKVTVTLVSTMPGHTEDDPDPVDVVWCNAGDEFTALESVMKNMRDDAPYTRVEKITVEPVRPIIERLTMVP